MTTPYENGYQLGVQHRNATGGDLSGRIWREYEVARGALADAYNANQGVLASFEDGYLRGRYGMGARKVGGGSTPW